MEKAHSQEVREQNLLPKHQKAIQMALKGLKVEELMKEGGSDDGVSMSSIGSQVFRGTLKKLPHIIGTSYFFHDPWIGLFEEDEQKLETNDEAFTTVFEAKDAPKMGESPMNTVTNNPGYSAPVPPPMPKTAPPVPPPTTNTPMSSQKAPPPPPPPPQRGPSAPLPGGPPPPPPAAVASMNNFQKGLAMTLEKRKAIIDGEATGDLSVKNILVDESKALGLPAPKPPPVNTPKPQQSAPTGPPPPPPAFSTPTNIPNPPPVQQVSETTKRPEEMSLEDKKKQLAGILGGMPQMRPKVENPEPQNTNLYQQPPPESNYSQPSNAYQAPPPSQNLYQQPPPPPASSQSYFQASPKAPAQAFLPHIEEEEEVNSLFSRPTSKAIPKEKKNVSLLFDTPNEEEKINPKNEAKKTRAEGLFKFINDDDDADTANLLLNSELAKKKLGKTTTDNPFLFSSDKPKVQETPLTNKPISVTQSNPPLPKIEEKPKKEEENPFLFNKPAPPKKIVENPTLFSKPEPTTSEKPKAAPSDDPLSSATSKIVSAFAPQKSIKDTNEDKSPRASIKDIRNSMPMPLFGGPPPPRQEKPVEVSLDAAMSKPVRKRLQKTTTSKFDDFEDNEPKLTKSSTFMNTSAKDVSPFSKTTVPQQNNPDSIKMPSLGSDPLKMPSMPPMPSEPPKTSSDAIKMPVIGNSLPSFGSASNNTRAASPKPLPVIKRDSSPKPSARREVNFDPLMGGFRGPAKKPEPRPSIPKEEEKKAKPKTNLFDDDDEELSFRPAKPVQKAEPVARKGRGSIFDD